MGELFQNVASGPIQTSQLAPLETSLTLEPARRGSRTIQHVENPPLQVDAQAFALILLLHMSRSTTNLVCCLISRPFRKGKTA
jgi:hypothetical protein